MNIRFLLFFFLFTTCWQLFSNGQNNLITDHIYIKIKQDVVAKLQPTVHDPLNTGVPAMDALNKKYRVVSMQRLFPSAGQFENKHRQSGLHQWYIVGFNGISANNAVVNSYSKSEAIEYAEPVYDIVVIGQKSNSGQSLAAAATPAEPTNDPLLQGQWNYQNTGKLRGCTEGVDIRLYDAWKTMRGAPNVIVALMDHAVDVTHPDLAANIWVNAAEKNGADQVDDDKNGYPDDYNGYNFSTTPKSDFDKNLGGTAAAGIIAAGNNNGTGIASVAGGAGGNGAKIMVCAISGKKPNLAAAFVYAADNGAVICQADWHYSKPGVYNRAVYEAIQYFVEHAGEDEYGNPRRGTLMRGGLIVAPAGDENNSVNYYPQAFNEVMSVAAVTGAGKKARYSNYGSTVSLAAPGGDADYSKAGMLITTLPNNRYDYLLGTALACAHVTGTAALLLAEYGNAGYSPEMLHCRIYTTTRPLSAWEPSYQKGLGAGLLDAGKALTARFPAVQGVSLSTNQLKIKEGETARLQAQVFPNDACARKIIWTSTKPNIASVSSSGLVKALAEGTTDIVATTAEGGFKAIGGVEVTPPDYRPVSGITLATAAQNIGMNEEFSLVATVLPQDAGNKAVSWSSSNPTAVSVSATGKVRGLKCGGAATITATTNDGNFTAHCVVTVGKLLSGISLSKLSLSLVINETQHLSAGLLPQDACPAIIQWKSSDPNTVSVDQEGRVKGLACGGATITVSTDAGFSNNCVVTVGQAVSGVALSDKELTISLGQEQGLTVAILPANSCNKTVAWKSDRPSIVSVDQQGRVKGLACGEALVTVSSNEGNFTATCSVKVGMSVSGISLSETNLNLSLSQEVLLTANALPSQACNKAVNWTSSNPNYVSVDAKGRVKGLRCGKATITVTTVEGAFTASCAVEVGKPVTGVSLQPGSLELPVNDRRKLTLTVLPADACNVTASWSSSNPAVASISNDGIVTAIACGEVVISATTNDGGFSARCNLKVGQALTGISLSPSSLEMNVNQEQQLKASILPAGACEKRLSWVSSDPSVVAVDNNGRIKALACGSSTILVTASEGGFTAQCTVTVGKRAMGVSLSRTSATINVRQEEALTANVLPSNACNARVSWVSSNPSAVSVSQNGVIKGIAKGSSTITITTADGGFQATCDVKVE